MKHSHTMKRERRINGFFLFVCVLKKKKSEEREKKSEGLRIADAYRTIDRSIQEKMREREREREGFTACQQKKCMIFKTNYL